MQQSWWSLLLGRGHTQNISYKVGPKHSYKWSSFTPKKMAENKWVRYLEFLFTPFIISRNAHLEKRRTPSGDRASSFLGPGWMNGWSSLSRWWFQIFFIFTPIWGNDPFWLIFFSNGLKPPTSYLSIIFMSKTPRRAWNLEFESLNPMTHPSMGLIYLPRCGWFLG